MLLKRLHTKLPPNLAPFIPELESAGIKTTESLIFTAPSTILALTSTITHVQLRQLVSVCIRLTSGGIMAASEMEYGDVEGPWRGFGVKGLDEMVESWDGVGVLEIAGPRKVGKSLLALHAVLRTLADIPEASCMWLDTEGTFAPERAVKILELWKVSDPHHILQRISVTPCFQLDNVHGALESLKAIVVLDTIFTHFKDRLTNTSAQGHAELVSLMEDLSALSFAHNLVVLVINSTVTSFPTNPLSRFNKTNIKPALGTAFTYCTDATLLMQETGKVFGMMDEEERERVRRAPGLRALLEVVRSRVSPTGRWAVFDTVRIIYAFEVGG
ncbi:hypothetical protein L202_00194 [Cryptococcus amylolentus CBS 6039]|uniref:Rad51-like C-terminal domain-containing protein n=2 Tax=Cryptococcus amylolentus TaxID=104669 RepID=A0A1E3I763_9TREE|nr:hypothetical protein L202_00194 [Cryptococcus amylolentus CBS 6039]ODN84195.1 hypothetical protein L202_00194 [Cryptococcus amylolentus CBS 6039]ODO11950.1 hypothetical protein I350_00734 [Cryptococcus amylolentus CBS 6273]